MKVKKKKLPLYVGNLLIVQLEEGEDISLINKKYNISEDITDYDAITLQEGTNFIICFSESTTIPTIAHECLHVVSFVFNYCSINYDVYNDEPAAYLLGWLVEECLKTVKFK